jgi:hypothetical protein
VAISSVALDRAQLSVISNGGRWLVSWHGPDDQPEGKAHGATGICRTMSGEVVLVSPDGEHWGFPGGRTEPGETWRETLDREMEEEACGGVLQARLIGWGRGECLSGEEEGLVIVRSNWAVTLELFKWWPRFEIAHRKLVLPSQAYDQLTMEPGMEPIYRRQLKEAGLPYA